MPARSRPITAIDEKYRVIARVGRGGVADVNVAVAQGPGGFNKLVVLKSLREEFRGDADYRDMFMAEARLNAQLRHPHIVQTNEVFEFDGLPVIVMEYLEGQSLGAVVRMARKQPGSAFDQSMHLRVLSDILHALDYAHNKQGMDGSPLALVHCDVTPQNIFLTYEGEVKLLDFGIARQLSTKGDGLGGEVMGGKMRYMPPEQIRRVGVDQRADLYAVGVMAWEAAAGVRLWADTTDDEIRRAVLAGEIPAPSRASDEVDPELERIVMRALEPDKEKRYPTALAMQMELDGFLGISGTHLRSRDIGAAVTALFEARRAQVQGIVAEQLAKLAALPKGGNAQLRLVDLPQATLLSEYPPPPRPARRRRTAPFVASAALALLGGLGLVLWASDEPRAEVEPQVGPRLVELRITAFPEEAVIALDGVQVGANPYSESREPSSEKHEIRVSAPGYETAIRTVTLEAAADIVIALSSLPPSEPDERRPAEPPAASAVVLPAYRYPSQAAEKKPGCDPPAYFDENGIKHFKPQCL